MNENISEKKYLVFQCKNCNTWRYAKVTQKKQKCTICGKTTDIAQFLNKMDCKKDIINGITNANHRVRELNTKYSKSKSSEFKSIIPVIKLHDNSEYSRIKTSPNESLLSKLTSRIIEIEKLDRISEDLGLPDYYLQLLINELCENPIESERLMESFKTHPNVKKISNDSWYVY